MWAASPPRHNCNRPDTASDLKGHIIFRITLSLAALTIPLIAAATINTNAPATQDADLIAVRDSARFFED